MDQNTNTQRNFEFARINPTLLTSFSEKLFQQEKRNIYIERPLIISNRVERLNFDYRFRRVYRRRQRSNTEAARDAADIAI